MKKWLKHLNSTPFGFMPAGPRLAATGYCASVFFFRRKAADDKNGPGRIARTAMVTEVAKKSTDLSMPDDRDLRSPFCSLLT
jgi:hypothetical protein